MSDGSTDSSTAEEEIVCVRFVVEGQVHVHYIGIQCVERADAASLKKAICDILKSNVGVDDEIRIKLLKNQCRTFRHCF